MTREEAINEIKSWNFLEGKEIEAIQTIIPELKENEDERIRNIITDSIFYQYGASDEYNDVLDYLDKLEKHGEKFEDISTVLLIKKEIERRIETWQKSRKKALSMKCNTLADDAAVRIEELHNLVSFLDTIRCGTNEEQKEPLNHTESYMKGFSDGCEAERESYGVSDEKRTVDIQAIEKRSYEVFPDDDDENTPLYREAFIDGAVDYIDCGCKRLAKWSEEDEKMRGRAICACNFTIKKLLGSKHYEEARDWLKSLPVGFITNPHYNSDMVGLLVGELQSIAESVEAPNLYDAEISWLKSLRSQPAQEWSEEDAALLKEIVSFFKDGTVKLQHDLDLYAGFLENKFKSLRPSWRPSEEHMETLKRFIGPSPTGMILADLYGKLEKLK